jgi:NADPH:quinone reductase-like Zn-dependent oxidoreductase
MKAYIVDRFKKGAALRWGDVPEPVVNATDVLVEVHAAGVNQLDAMLRDGDFRQILPLKPPFIAGHDVAGIIVHVGAGVTAFRPGDAVYARPRDTRIGGFQIAVYRSGPGRALS